jgi:hypothetical protein
MLLVLLVLAAVWALVILGAVALCVAAAHGDEAGAADGAHVSPRARARRFAPAP